MATMLMVCKSLARETFHSRALQLFILRWGITMLSDEIYDTCGVHNKGDILHGVRKISPIWYGKIEA